jgi:hypothetical protein
LLTGSKIFTKPCTLMLPVSLAGLDTAGVFVGKELLF